LITKFTIKEGKTMFLNIISSKNNQFIIIFLMTIVMISTVFLVTTTESEAAWRKEAHTPKINGYYLYARANLPYFSDIHGGGDWKAQGDYKGSKKNNKLKLAWSFYSVGGSVSYSGVGVSGSGSSPGSNFTVTGNTANASGRVYANGLCLYVGLDVTPSFTYGNSYYSTTAHI
jgi:hypothetical protein